MIDDRNLAVRESPLARPWVQLAIGVICMASVANMQYGWTLFVDPIQAEHHWKRATIQTAFGVFVAIETWLVPFEGYLVDRFGPRWVVVVGGVLVAVSWCMNSVAASLPILYTAAVIGGIGTGSVYGTCVGNALKWFPGRRGLAAGITASGFGAGAALTILPIASMIKSSGYQHAFWFFGLMQGGIVFAAAWMILAPPSRVADEAARRSQSAPGFSPAEVLRSPVFYVMYAMFVLIAAGGLTMAANVAPIAKDLKIADSAVGLFGATMAALPFALMLNRIFDGVGRPFFGWLSDRIGREHTMALAFLLGAAALYVLAQSGSSPIAFVLVTAFYFGVYGEIFSLFPATQGDTFGAKFATANNGMLYTAKGMGALFTYAATALAAARGWTPVFEIAMAFNITAALLAIIVLKPMRARHFASVREARALRADAVGSGG